MLAVLSSILSGDGIPKIISIVVKQIKDITNCDYCFYQSKDEKVYIDGEFGEITDRGYRKDLLGTSFPKETVITKDFMIQPIGKDEGILGICGGQLQQHDLDKIKDQIEVIELLCCTQYSSPPEFIRKASSEIRYPVRALVNAVTDNKNIKTLIPRTAALDLVQTINNIFEYHALISDSVKLSKKPFLVGVAVEDAKSLVSVPQGTILKCNVQPYTPHLLGDKTKIVQILSVILGNSFKYRKSTSLVENVVEMIIYSRKIKQNTHKVFFEIKDNGVGMSSKEIENVFLPFQKKGSGLSLAICKELIERCMGGEISIKGEIDVGTEVSFWIVLDEVKDTSLIKKKYETKLSSTKVVVITKDKTFKFDAIKKLGILGCSVQVVTSTNELVDYISCGISYNIAIVDTRTKDENLSSVKLREILSEKVKIIGVNTSLQEGTSSKNISGYDIVVNDTDFENVLVETVVMTPIRSKSKITKTQKLR